MKLLPTRLTAIALAAAGIPIEFALAQDAEKPLEKVVITARKRSEPLQEVPVAAKTFSAQTLADENIVDQKSLVARTASASTVEQGASFASEVVLRGAGVGRAVNAETSTGLYRNGAYAAGGNIGGRAFNKMDFFDVQRVEVMRGPQAALYGRGAVGGAMNIINNRPSAVASRALTLTGGPYDSFGMEAIINQPISDAVNIRAGLKTSSSKGGAVRDVTTSEALDSDRFDGARVSMEINPGGSFNYNLMVDGFSESGPSFGVFQYELAKPETRFTRNFNSPARFGRNEWTAIGEGVWDLGGPTVVALTQLKRRKASTSDDFDRFNVVSNANLQRWQRLSDDDMERFGQELRIQGKDGQRLQWLAGAEYLRLKDRFTVDLNGAIARARANNSISTTVSDDTSIGMFGLLGYDITDQLNLTGELRQQQDKKDFELLSTTNTFPTGTAPTLQDTGPATTNTLRQNYERTFNSLAKVLALRYKANSALNGYLRYGEADRPGGFNNDPDRNIATSTPAGPRFSIPYEQEHARTMELGIKTEWFQRALRANLAVYRSEMEGILLNNSVSSAPPGSSTTRVIQFIENGGDARIEGAELDLYLEVAAPGPDGRFIVEGSTNVTSTRITAGRFDGKDIPQTRPKASSLGLTYQFRPAGLARAFVNVNTQQLNGGFQDPANVSPMDKVDILNINLGLRAKNWFAVLNVANVNDYLYITNYNNAQRTTGYTNLPRTWSFRAGMTF